MSRSPERVGSSLTIATGATLELRSKAFEFTDAGAFINHGTLAVIGDDRLDNFTNDTRRGTVSVRGPSTYTSLPTGNAYHHLTMSGAGRVDLGANLAVSGSLIVSHGTLNANTRTITVRGPMAVTHTVNALPVSADTLTDVERQGNGGGRGSASAMRNRILAAQKILLARFRSQSERDTDEEEEEGSPTSPNTSSAHSSSPINAPCTSSVIMVRRERLALRHCASVLVYTDLPIDAWFTPYVSSLIEDGIAEGYADESGEAIGQFGVADPVTSAEVLKMAANAAGVTLPGGSPRSASARGTWAAPYIAWAESAHLSLYHPTLDVHAPATRGAVLQTILEVLGITVGKSPSTYTDVPVTHPYVHAIAAATFFGLVEGDRNDDGSLTGLFRPDDSISRAEIAKILALARGFID